MRPSAAEADIEAQSSIARYVHRCTNSQLEREKKRYEEEEPLAKSKSWDEFLRLAISYQCLEGKGPNAEVEIRSGDQLLSRTRLKPNSYMGFGKRQNPDLDRAIANLEQKAQRLFEKSNEERRRQHSRRHMRGEDVPRGSGKCREMIVMQSRYLRCQQADDEDAEPRRESQPSLMAQPIRPKYLPFIYEEEFHRTGPPQRSSYGPGPPQEYVIPPRPSILIQLPNPSSESRPRDHPPPSETSLGGRTLIGSGYSSYAHDSFYDGPRGARSGRDSMADGGSRAGSHGGRSGVSRESTRSDRSAYTDDKRRDPEAIEARITGAAVAVIVGVGQAAGPLEAHLDPEATIACLCLIGEAVAVTIGVGQAAGDLEAGISMTRT